METPIKKVCVAGAGQMGRQIAMNSALCGCGVALYDANQAALDQAAEWARDYLAGRVQKGRLTQEEADRAGARLAFRADLEEACRDADLVVEAIIEDVTAKKELFVRICGLVRTDTLIASNSSSMVPSTFLDAVTAPERFANLHYFNPALVMKLVEVVGSPRTAPETLERLTAFARDMGKRPVVLKKEIDGFIANRVLRAISAEAMYLAEEGIADPQDIDAALELGLGHPMGPFRLDDLVGLDVAYLVAKKRYEDTGVKQIGYDLLEQKYQAGEWGKKTGKGWYDYGKGEGR